MNTTISDYPNSYLTVSLSNREQIITERGSMVYADGDYELSTKFEVRNIDNWLGKFFGGKSITYNIYKSKGECNLIFSPDENAEILEIPLVNEDRIIIEPSSHFARVGDVSLKIVNKGWKTTFNDGLKMLAKGKGSVFVVGYGKIIKKTLNYGKEYLIDEEYLVAYEDNLEVKMISRGLKELIKSGEGYLYQVKGEGSVWIQTRQKNEMSSKGGLLSRIIDLFKF